MKTYKAVVCNPMFILILLVAACSPFPEKSITSSTSLSTDTQMPLSSVTPFQKSTSMRTDISSNTPSPVTQCHTQICMESTPNPTLSPPMQERFFELLNNNGSCDLPCFLGIVPGYTTWSVANAVLEPFASHKPIVYDKSRATLNKRTYSTTIDASTIIEIPVRMVMDLAIDVDQNDVVQHIVINFQLYGDGYTEFHEKHLSQYGLREVFLRNGPPDNIYFKHEWKGYVVSVVYEKLKMVINFGGYPQKRNNDGQYSACPNLGDGDVADTTIALASQSDPIDVKTLIGYPFYESPTIEQSIGLSVDDFYNSIVSDKQPACFLVK